MIEINEVKQIINNNLPDRGIIDIKTEDSLGYIVAKLVISPEPLPGFTNSAMDGFAVKWDDIKDLQSGNNIELELIGESAAGKPFVGNIPNNKAIRINTGALLPNGVDTVIPIENLEEKDGKIILSKPTRFGANVRYQGEEIQKGDKVLNENDRITIPVISLLSSLGINIISVFKKPDISLIVTGSELVQGNGELKAGQIRDSNSIMLKTAINYAGGVLIFSTNSKDSIQDIKDAIGKAITQSDVILMSGGVSVGTHDLVKQAAFEMGFKQLFWQIRQKPGKPLYFAKKGDKILFGLPGHSVSALNSFMYYVFPFIYYLRGIEFKWKKYPGIVQNDIINDGNRYVFYRATIKQNGGNNIIEIYEEYNSPTMPTFAKSNGFIIVKPYQQIKKNEIVEINLFPWEF